MTKAYLVGQFSVLAQRQCRGSDPDIGRASGIRPGGDCACPLTRLPKSQGRRRGLEFVQELRKLGCTTLTADDLVSMRIHGATVAWVKQLQERGYKRLSADRLATCAYTDQTAEYHAH